MCRFFILIVTCLGLQEEEPQTAYPMSFRCISAAGADVKLYQSTTAQLTLITFFGHYKTWESGPKKDLEFGLIGFVLITLVEQICPKYRSLG